MKVCIAAIVAGLALLVVPHLGAKAPTPLNRVSAPTEHVTELDVSDRTLTGQRPDIAPSTSTSPSTNSPPSTSTSTSTSTTRAPGPTTTLRPVDTDEVRFPIIQALPFETPNWKVDYRMEGAALILRITLTPIINRPEQLAARAETLKASKVEVLAWLTSKGAPPGTYGVIWTPSDASKL